MGSTIPFEAGAGESDLLRRARHAPMLSRETEASLVRAWKQGGDETALARLIDAYLRLVIAAARRFRSYGLPLPDLIQEGVIGLMEAARRFDLSRDVRFSTYANWWVRAAMQDHILRNWSIVRTGTTGAHKALFFNLSRLKARHGADGESALRPEARQRIAQELRVREEDVLAMEGRLGGGGDRSLNAAVGGEGDLEWQDRLAVEGETPLEKAALSIDADRRKRLLDAALAGLTPRELVIVSGRQLSEEPRTLSELGLELGISKERVRQIETRALLRLKEALEAMVGDPVEAGLLAS